jgi:cell division septation protein DedD
MRNTIFPTFIRPAQAIFYLAAMFILPIAIFWPEPTAALTIDSARDCNANSILNCGAATPAEVKQKYDNDSHARSVYHYFGITHIDVDNLHSQAVEGRVTKGGRVLINDREVATNASTTGYYDMGNSRKVTANGTTFYVRAPSESFQSDSLPAFVMMKDGQFDFAIIASCGNPVIATPTKVAPASAPAPVAAVRPTPPPQTVVVTNTVPVPTPVPTPVPQPQPKQIPNTGIGDVAGFGSFVTLLGGGAHYIYKRSKFGLR